MTVVKICGLTREIDADYLNEFLPDYAGFIFVKGRRRYISPYDAGFIRERLDRRIKTVGVFIDEPPESLLSIAESGVINAVQLHGSENENYIRYIMRETKLPVIKAFRVQSADDIKGIRTPADMVLLDSGAGSGKTFDHSLLEGISIPYFLAGGITPENAAEIIEKYAPFGLDISSGVETDGYKDYNKIKKFMETVRAADSRIKKGD